MADDSKDTQETVQAKPTDPEPLRTQVQFAYQPGGPYPSHCGYCHDANEQFKLEGIWSENMSARDFQSLVDRGFQRSGKFVYLPANKLTCCPQYVLRLDSKTFRVSKQQRRVIRKTNEYLINGKNVAIETSLEDTNELDSEETKEGVVTETGASKEGAVATKKTKPTPGAGPDPNKPLCKKAKLRRQEKRAKKQLEKMAATRPTEEKPNPASMETEEKAGTDMVKELRLPDSSKHKFTVRLLCTNPMDDEFGETYEQSYEVFRKFQMIIHKEPPEKCGMDQFDQFCIESPLQLEGGPPGTDIQYGSFHQQYWVDDDLVMVGVLDIIPQGVLCNYLYYNPEYRFIAPGVYSALQEIAMTQELCRKDPSLRYYYMGYYVHSCPKMNYKRRYDSSYLLCPETHRYEPLEACRQKLDKEKYCQFSDEDTPAVTPPTEKAVEGVLIASSSSPTGYITYSELRGRIGNRLDDMITKYIEIVGEELAHSMILQIAGI